MSDPIILIQVPPEESPINPPNETENAQLERKLIETAIKNPFQQRYYLYREQERDFLQYSCALNIAGSVLLILYLLHGVKDDNVLYKPTGAFSPESVAGAQQRKNTSISASTVMEKGKDYVMPILCILSILSLLCLGKKFQLSLRINNFQHQFYRELNTLRSDNILRMDPSKPPSIYDNVVTIYIVVAVIVAILCCVAAARGVNILDIVSHGWNVKTVIVWVAVVVLFILSVLLVQDEF
jgi:hypothetical protein